MDTQPCDGPEIQASRPSDLWATGCVFLELLIWLLVPKQERTDHTYVQDRTRKSSPTADTEPFWHRDQNGEYSLRPNVERSLTDLRDHQCRDQPAFMNVLEVTRGLLIIDPKRRLTALQLFGALDGIIKQAERP
jgi:hypothetical protein